MIAHDETISPWYQLYKSDQSNYFGQRNYISAENIRYFGRISRINLRIDQSASSMPYYLCIHSTNNNGTFNGCTYISSNFDEKEQEYPLRDAQGNPI